MTTRSLTDVSKKSSGYASFVVMLGYHTTHLLTLTIMMLITYTLPDTR